ncbi:DNA pilot protein [Sigmofec virus UA08Rod_5492]|uniref:DNA pilot protein n=1 Tax=Sigmofec virus UA08Rod_5492 TaxID=2929426 RepID=A0A976R5A1_9VIRU|nr:DNA pilot protein [Sigmofec virus UA08Rod_5492]
MGSESVRKSAVDSIWDRGSKYSGTTKVSSTTGTSSAGKISSSGTTSGRTSGGWSTGNSVSAAGGGLGAIGNGGLSGIGSSAATALGSLAAPTGATSGSSGQSGGSSHGITISGTNTAAAMAYNREMMELANKAAAEEAQKNRDWQKMMSDTAFQRAVEDMKKAGINPILAAGTQAPMGYGSAAATHMASGYPEAWSQGTTEASNWGVNSSYSYNNFAQAIGNLVSALAGSSGKIKEGIEDMIDKGVTTAKNAWDRFGKPTTDMGKLLGKFFTTGKWT